MLVLKQDLSLQLQLLLDETSMNSAKLTGNLNVINSPLHLL
jgi:hypothetical protein